MFRIGESSGKCDIKVDETQIGNGATFCIDDKGQLKFFVDIDDDGYYLNSDCEDIATVYLEFFLWLKHVETGITVNENKLITFTFRKDDCCEGYDEGVDLSDYIKDGIISVYYRIQRAEVLVMHETAIFEPKPELYDCVIRAGDRNFKASKYALGLHSDVFAALWKTDMNEGKTNEMKVDDFDADTVRHMLDFVHSFGYDFSAEKVDELFKIADKYQLILLKEKCIDTMMKSITKKKFCQYLIIAFQYSVENLKEKTIRFARNDECRKILVNSEAFTDLGRKDYDLFVEIMQSLYEE